MWSFKGAYPEGHGNHDGRATGFARFEAGVCKSGLQHVANRFKYATPALVAGRRTKITRKVHFMTPAQPSLVATKFLLRFKKVTKDRTPIYDTL
ncbi:hypothetical protein KDD17_04830 [Sulfitobacter albidus]|uniref:Uncharacterized protein n=1 Tax=Sulfitobacter albidus TaxID=2829501 RepID=A0A975PN29_9RHOB|nr:hypothetical protein [Sulfitobacter albidus]QUJ77329.1 hypothetical protein KDD17_04830 [Sulfitobacter albidus]